MRRGARAARVHTSVGPCRRSRCPEGGRWRAAPDSGAWRRSLARPVPRASASPCLPRPRNLTLVRAHRECDALHRAQPRRAPRSPLCPTLWTAASCPLFARAPPPRAPSSVRSSPRMASREENFKASAEFSYSNVLPPSPRGVCYLLRVISNHQWIALQSLLHYSSLYISNTKR